MYILKPAFHCFLLTTGSNDVLESISADKDIQLARVGAKGLVVTTNSNSYLLKFPSTKGKNCMLLPVTPKCCLAM